MNKVLWACIASLVLTPVYVPTVATATGKGYCVAAVSGAKGNRLVVLKCYSDNGTNLITLRANEKARPQQFRQWASHKKTTPCEVGSNFVSCGPR